MNKNLKVKCPSCSKKFQYLLSKFRPFCSERCKMIDLGQWLDGQYLIASKEELGVEDLELVVDAYSKKNEE